MDDIKGRHFEGQVILCAVGWCCKSGVSSRELEEMLEERGVAVHHATIHRWTQRCAPEIRKRLRWCWRRPCSTNWRMDETDVKVRLRWAYLDRATDKRGDSIDFHLSPTRNAKAAKRLQAKALRGLRALERPTVINIDKAATCGPAIAALKEEGKLGPDTQHRQVQSLDNRLGADRGWCTGPSALSDRPEVDRLPQLALSQSLQRSLRRPRGSHIATGCGGWDA